MSFTKCEKAIDGFSNLLGKLAALLLVLLLVNVFYDVVMRYLFNDVSIAMQELEWHLYASVFLLGIAYTLHHDGHVRVDLFYERWSLKARAWVNLHGCLVFLLPFMLLVGYYGMGFMHDAFQMKEQSGDPGGLSYRWLIKAMIPLSCVSVMLSGLGVILQSMKQIQGCCLVERRKQIAHEEGLA